MTAVPTITMSQLVAAVKEDLHKYDAENLIDPIRLEPTIARCNAILGTPIYQSGSCVTRIKNYQADLPKDFYRMETVFLITESKYYTGLLATGNHYEWEGVRNACMCDGHTAVCVNPIEQHQQIKRYTSFIRVNAGENLKNTCTKYSPNLNWSSTMYNIDLDEDKIVTNFEEGILYIEYLKDLKDPETGETLVPFHGRLYDYYAWSLKVKILEDMMLNTEADVANALSYAKQERNLSAMEAIDFVSSKSYKSWTQTKLNHEKDFFRKWYAIVQ